MDVRLGLRVMTTTFLRLVDFGAARIEGATLLVRWTAGAISVFP
jgi:hypothetical protein